MQSIIYIHAILFFGAALVLVGMLSSMVASRFGAPLILVFLGLGMLAGQDGIGGIAFNDYELTYFIGSLSLAVILFDGGLRTRMNQLSGALAPAAVLATAGVLVTSAVIGVVAVYVMKLSFVEGMLLGALVASTDAAAVFFLLRTGGLQLQKRVGATLEIESGTNDPFAVLLTVLLVSLLITDPAHMTGSWLDVLIFILRQTLIGTAAGLGGGLAMAMLLNRVELPSGLHPLVVMTNVVLLYALTVLADGSGFLAVYVAGLVIGNKPVRSFSSIISFHDTATWLCQIMMFMVLGLLITPSRVVDYILPGLAIAGVLIVVARPLAVYLCLTPFGYTQKERLFISWVGLRGAVSIFLAAIPTLANVPKAEMYFNIAFVVVFVSLVVQGWTLRPMARKLRLDVRHSAPVVNRIEIDLPGQFGHEMVGYPVGVRSPVLVHKDVPKWARPTFVIRDDAIHDPRVAGPLQPGDYTYYLIPRARARDLDRLFARPMRGIDRTMLATFPLRPDTRLSSLIALYDLPLPEGGADVTIAQLLTEQFENEPQSGDRFTLGPAAIVVRSVEEGVIMAAELEIEIADTSPDIGVNTLKGTLLPARFRAKAAQVWEALFG